MVLTHGKQHSPSSAIVASFVEAFDGLIRAVIVPDSHASAHALGLGPQDVRGLLWLGAHGACLMSDFAKGVGVPLSTATHLANRLVEKGVIARNRSDEDRRVVHVSLNPLGERVYGEIFAQRVSTSQHLLRQLNEAEQSRLVELMHKLLAHKTSTEAPHEHAAKELSR